MEKEVEEDFDLTLHKRASVLMRAYRSFRASRKLGRVRDHFNTQEVCNETVGINSLSLAYVADHFKTQDMCNEVARNKPYMMLFVSDHLITQEMCNEIMRTMLDAFYCIPDNLKHNQCVMRLLRQIHGS